MVPESLKAVALWYDKSALPTPPTTSDELLAGVKDGSIKIGINQGVYHQFGWTGAFGGQLLDDTGKCIADQGGFADAFAYLKSLKDAGATFNTDGNALKTDFQTGKLNAIIDGPWQTADFRTALGDNLAVVPIPAGPAGPANPFTGTDGWYINPNLDEAQAELAVNVALALTSAASEQVFVDDAGHVPANPAVAITDPITQGFSDAAAGGLPRPQSAAVQQLVGPVRRCPQQGHRHRRRSGHGDRRCLRPDERGERPLGPPLAGRGAPSRGRPTSLAERVRST